LLSPRSHIVAYQIGRNLAKKHALKIGLMITPALHGRFTWQAQTLSFWPDSIFQPGTIYHVTLQPGAAGLSGRELLFTRTWTVQVRQPQVVYLAHLQDGAEIVLIRLQEKRSSLIPGGR
jgi:hypothetical protein